MHIRQAEVSALVEAGRAFVINTQEAQHGGVEIVGVDAAFYCAAADVSRL